MKVLPDTQGYNHSSLYNGPDEHPLVGALTGEAKPLLTLLKHTHKTPAFILGSNHVLFIFEIAKQ